MILTTKVRRYGLVAASVLLAGGAIAFGAASSDGDRGVREAKLPSGESFPISRSIDASSLEYRGRVGEAEAYLAKGVGPAAGMTCLVIATGDITRTACDEPAAVEARGLVLSEDAGPGQLWLTGYLPGGVSVGADSKLNARGDFFEGPVSKSEGTVQVERGGRSENVLVPGATQ